MKSKDFESLVKNVFEHCEKLLNGIKKDEYAGEKDRLRNFKTGGVQRETIPEDYLLGIKAKHTASISDMVKDLKQGKEYPLTLWREKITDEINYHVLLLALLVERSTTTAYFTGNQNCTSAVNENEIISPGGLVGHRDDLNVRIAAGKNIFFNITDVEKKKEICCAVAFISNIHGYNKVFLRTEDGSILENFVMKAYK